MSDFAAYTFYVNRPDLLLRSVRAFPDLVPELTVVNNSGKTFVENASAEEAIECCFKAHDLFEPPVPLTYAQSINWMLGDALARDVDFIIHFHSDAFSTNPNAVQELLSYARKVKNEGKKWVCLYTFYDILWCLNVDALRNMGGWDTNFPTYFGDNDFRRRAFLEGYECIDTGIQGIGHEGSATINSDRKLQFLNSRVFPLHEELYREKHGGPPGKERFLHPYGQEWLSWKP